MRALIEGKFAGDPAYRIDERIEFRRARQRILERDPPPTVEVVLGEAALIRPVGGPKILLEQVGALAEACHQAGVTIRILPLDRCAHPDVECSFTLIEFADVDDPAVVHLEYPAGALRLDRPADVRMHIEAFDLIQAAALTVEESTALLRRHAAGA